MRRRSRRRFPTESDGAGLAAGSSWRSAALGRLRRGPRAAVVERLVGQAATHLDRKAVLNFTMSTTIPGLDPQKWWNGAAACGQLRVFESLLSSTPTPETRTAGQRPAGRLEQRPDLHVQAPAGSQVQQRHPAHQRRREVLLRAARHPVVRLGGRQPVHTLAIKGMSDVVNQKAKTLSGITTPDPHTVVFDFDFPDSAFIYLIAQNLAGVVPMSLVEDVGFSKFNWSPVGNRPVHRGRRERAEPHHAPAEHQVLESLGAQVRCRQLADGHR